MKTQIKHIVKSSFEKDGKSLSFCKVTFISNVVKDENEIGEIYESLTTKVDNYSIIAPLIGTTVDLDFDYKKKSDGSYKKVITSINGNKLI